jgi:hypothetical protein
MLRIKSLAAAAAVLGYAGLALARQPGYSPDAYRSDWNRYTTQPTTGTTTMPERQTWAPWRQQTMTPSRQTSRMDAGLFTSEGDARAHCGADAVVWVNTKSHVYHFVGSRDYGRTKHGGFMCRASAEGAGTYRAAKNELRMQEKPDRTSLPRSGSSFNRY